VACGYDGPLKSERPLGTAGVDETAPVGAIELVVTCRVSHGCKGARMSNALDVQQTLNHCMLNIKDASEAMAHDMYSAAMKLGAAAMMLASASNTVYRHSVQPTSVRTPLDTGEEPGA
jgi:hypothetical protein